MPQVPSPLGRLPDHKLLLGLFLPMQQGAWSSSKAPRSTSWTFDYITRCATTAEALGFDLVFGLAQWLGKGGYGGEMHFREHEVDPIIAQCRAHLADEIDRADQYRPRPLRMASFASRKVRRSHGPHQWRTLGHQRRHRLQAERIPHVRAGADRARSPLRDGRRVHHHHGAALVRRRGTHLRGTILEDRSAPSWRRSPDSGARSW